MLILIAKGIVKEGLLEEFKKRATELVKETRKEPGNISYRILQGTENPLLVTFLEEWQDQEAMEYHFNAEHFKRILPTLFELQVEKFPPDIYAVMF